MKHIKLFEQFTTEKQLEFDFGRPGENSVPTPNPESDTADVEIDDAGARELGTMGFPTTQTFTFESPIFVHVDYDGWFERTANNYSVDEFVRQAEALDLDFNFEYRQYQNDEITEDEFYEAAWEEVKRSGFTEPLRYAGFVDKEDFEDEMIDDFNESKLENYCEVPGVEAIRAKEITQEGNFVVEVVTMSDTDPEAIKDYLSGQYSDGWGEGFEQKENKLDGGISYYIHTWRARDFEIKLVNP